MKLVLKDIAKLIKPLQKYVHEENDADLKIASLEVEINIIKELLLDTQSDVVILQKANARKTKKRKNK